MYEDSYKTRFLKDEYKHVLFNLCKKYINQS